MALFLSLTTILATQPSAVSTALAVLLVTHAQSMAIVLEALDTYIVEVVPILHGLHRNAVQCAEIVLALLRHSIAFTDPVCFNKRSIALATYTLVLSTTVLSQVSPIFLSQKFCLAFAQLFYQNVRFAVCARQYISG